MVEEKKYLNCVITGRKMGFCSTAQSFCKQNLRKVVLGRQHTATLTPLIDYSPEASYRKVTVCNPSKSKLSQIDHFMRAKLL